MKTKSAKLHGRAGKGIAAVARRIDKGPALPTIGHAQAPAIRPIIQHMKTAYPANHRIEEVIRDCAQRRFEPDQILVGINACFDVPLRMAKKLVMAHPVWGKRAEGWAAIQQAYMEMMERAPERMP